MFFFLSQFVYYFYSYLPASLLPMPPSGLSIVTIYYWLYSDIYSLISLNQMVRWCSEHLEPILIFFYPVPCFGGLLGWFTRVVWLGGRGWGEVQPDPWVNLFRGRWRSGDPSQLILSLHFFLPLRPNGFPTFVAGEKAKKKQTESTPALQASMAL